MAEPGRTQSEPTTFNILFVCTGNTCRSPMAMAIARSAAGDRGWTHVDVQSAGVAAVTGAPASAQALHVSAEHGLDLSTHESQPLTPELIDWADLVLVMSLSQLYAVADQGGGEKVAMVTEFLEGEGLGQSIEDPFGGDEDDYRRTFQQLGSAIEGVLQRLEPILSP